MIKIFLTIFATVLLAEMGDKTQLATMLFSAEAKVSRWLVFTAASAALIIAAAVGVLIGAQIEKLLSPRTVRIVAGIGFVAIGIWTLASKG